jgi:hypothetical protein
MVRDLGSGLTYDDLVGLSALEINRLHLPNDDLGAAIHKASQILTDKEFGKYILMELWGDGHSVWQANEKGQVVVVTPTGQLSINPGVK